MKKISTLLILTLALILSACSNNQPNKFEKLIAADDCDEKTLEGGWVCIWADEFEGDTLDSTKWTYEINDSGGGNNELQYYTDQNIEVNNSILSIIARKERFISRDYTSSRIVSKYKGDFTYGRIIVRAKNPVGGGTWPAIWMMPTMNTYGGWPRSGEIDIMEYVGNKPYEVTGTVHTEARFGGNTPVRSYLLPTANSEFHNYEIIWRPGSITWFVNGVQFNQVNYTPQFTQQYKYNQVFPFDQAFFLILNLAIGGTLGGQVDDSIFPTAFEVDYVRVYQQDYSITDKEAPQRVESISSMQLTNSIYWTPAQDDTDVKRYAIYLDGKFQDFSNLNQYTFRNLVKGQTYLVTIEAEDFAGRVSKISDQFSFTFE